MRSETFPSAETDHLATCDCTTIDHRLWSPQPQRLRCDAPCIEDAGETPALPAFYPGCGRDARAPGVLPRMRARRPRSRRATLDAGETPALPACYPGCGRDACAPGVLPWMRTRRPRSRRSTLDAGETPALPAFYPGCGRDARASGGSFHLSPFRATFPVAPAGETCSRTQSAPSVPGRAGGV